MTGVSTRPVRMSVVTAAAAAVALTLSAAPAAGYGGGGGDTDQKRAEFLAAGDPGPALLSDNVSFVGNFPETTAISGDFSMSTEHFYVSSLDTLSVFDVSEPEAPTIVGTLPNFVFENEAMNYGEQRKDGKLTAQFIMVGADLAQASPGDPSHVNVDEPELIIVDVTDPTNPYIRSRVKSTSSTHTVACIQRTRCNFVYSAGNKPNSDAKRGHFSIFDLRDLDNPREVDSTPEKPGIQGFRSPALAPNSIFTNGAGHKWNFVGGNLAYHTGSGGTAAFDVSRPWRPRLLTSTNKVAGTPEKATAWNNFIHHNSWQPHVRKYRSGAPASLKNGNVLLVTEEDYEQTDCSLAGSFQTWKVGNLRDPNAITPLDKVELTDLGGPAEGITPQGGFCSAHWFDYHQSGIVAAAYYNGGVRLLDVRDPENIQSFGFAQGGGETWDAYWVPMRDDKLHALRQKTNIIYSIDAVRGLDVYRVENLPGEPATQQRQGADLESAQPTAGVAVPVGALGALALLRLRRRARRAQR